MPGDDRQRFWSDAVLAALMGMAHDADCSVEDLAAMATDAADRLTVEWDKRFGPPPTEEEV
jgi:hypothetical protein